MIKPLYKSLYCCYINVIHLRRVKLRIDGQRYREMTYRTTVARNREGRWQGCASPFTVAVRSYVIAIGVDPSLRLSKKGVTKDNLRDLTNFYSRVRFSHSRCDFIYYRRREDEKGRKKRIGVSRSTNALETKYSSLHSCAKE